MNDSIRPSALSTSELELAYDWLAEAIDRAGAGRSELFLVKLVMLLTQSGADVQALRRCIDAALQDL